jgi:hypothetical protein
MLKETVISRDVATAAQTLDHDVGAATYSLAPTLATQGFYLRAAAGRNYDAYEITASFAGGDGTAVCTVRPWFWVPAHDPTGLAGGTWIAGKYIEGISAGAIATDTRAPARRLNSVPVAATRCYLQVVAITGTAPTNVYITCYGLEGPVATVDADALEVDIEGGDIEIGAVEIKDHTTDERGHVKKANAVVAVDDTVQMVQIQGPDGLATPSGASSAVPVWVDLAHAPVSAFTQATHNSPADFAAGFTSNVSVTCSGAPFVISDANCRIVYLLYKPVAGIWSAPLINGANGVSMTSAANVITVVGAGTPFAAGDIYWVGVQQRVPAAVSAFAEATHVCPSDFSAAFATNVTVLCSGAPFTIDSADNRVVYLLYRPAAGNWSAPLVNGANGVSLTAAANVITVTGAGTPFAAGDTYWIGVQAQEKGFSSAGNYNNVTEVSPINLVPITETLINSTNVAAATVQLPSASGMSMLGFSGLSISGQLIDVSSLIVEVTDDDSGTLWHQVYFYDCVNNLVTNIITATGITVNFAISVDNCNFHSVRVTYVTPDATNTLNVRCRRIY